MKRYLYLLLLIIFTNHNIKIFCQEEFFGNHNGLSSTYLQVFNETTNAIGVSVFFKKDFIAGISLNDVNNDPYPSVGILYCPDWSAYPNRLKIGFGPLYTYVQKHHIVGFDIGLVKCFFSESNFPFSINVSGSIQVAFIKNPSSPYITVNEKYRKDYISIVSYGYTQTFFANSKVYPFVGISGAYGIESKTSLYGAIIGININLD